MTALPTSFPATQNVPSHVTWTFASARAQNSERELTVLGWEGGPQDSAAVRDFAQDVDGSTLRAQRSERELTVQGWEGGPQSVMAIRDKQATLFLPQSVKE